MQGSRTLVNCATALLLSAILCAGRVDESRAEANGDASRVTFHREVVNLENLAEGLSRVPPTIIRKGPSDENDIWYGEILRQLPGDDITSREHDIPFAVLFEGSSVVRAWGDTNLNGDLSDDPSVALSLFPGQKPARSFLSDLHWSIRKDDKEISIERLVRVIIEIPDSANAAHRYRTQSVFGMLGSVVVDSLPRLALLYDANQDGLYSRGSSDGIFFDMDGDRHFSIDLMAPDFGPFAVPFSIGRTSYVVDSVDAQGAEVALRSLGPSTGTAAPTVGSPVPDFGYVDIEGRNVRLAAYRGKPVVVYFWSSWCGVCRRDAEDLRALYERYKQSQVEILGVSYDTDRREMERFRQQHRHSWPTSYTGGLPAQDPVGRSFRESGSGVFYLVAPDGRLAAKVSAVDELDLRLRKMVTPEVSRAPSGP